MEGAGPGRGLIDGECVFRFGRCGVFGGGGVGVAFFDCATIMDRGLNVRSSVLYPGNAPAKGRALVRRLDGGGTAGCQGAGDTAGAARRLLRCGNARRGCPPRWYGGGARGGRGRWQGGGWAGRPVGR